ncbi:MAG: 2-polyprenyl-6-methoxyphenol hydroxylase [unclassified Hahellaceae]|nr:2-polyprenyl-6-methoxyphenol hydroxylase [Hahellaceae bacterium]|tara:strand:+ start:11777 stop:13255 length:1479 start_codon:yes stop_codon:yes gene_type:complete
MAAVVDFGCCFAYNRAMTTPVEKPAISPAHVVESTLLHCDVLVIGGGITGASTALAIARSCPAAHIVLVEASKPDLAASQLESDFSPPGLRVSALNLQSERFLRGLDVWSELDAHRLKPYTALQVSENPDASLKSATAVIGGETTFSVDDLTDSAITHLGTIIENDLLQRGLWKLMTRQPNLTLMQAELLDLVQQQPQGVTAHLNAAGQVRAVKARLLIGADGAGSSVRVKAGIRQMAEGYEQKALVIGVELAERAGAMTWQLFRPAGPVAYLPLFDCEGAPADHCAAYASLVWYDSPTRIQALTQLDMETLLEQVLQNFPDKLPRIRRIYGRAAFPLVKSHCTSYSRGSVVLVGDAAHTVNPLAGQGLNMGLQDAEALSATVCSKLLASGACADGLEQALRSYERQRKPQNLLMTATVDAFYYAFSNDIAPLKLLRRLGLSIADKAGPLKRRVLTHALGLDQATGSREAGSQSTQPTPSHAVNGATESEQV